MRIYDISMAIDNKTFVYKNAEQKKPVFDVKQSGHVTETNLNMNLHTGTHIDAPLHMINGGAPVGDYDLSRFFTTAVVLDFSETEEKITAELLKSKHIPENSFVLLKTKNSFAECFDFDFVYLDEGGAAYLSALPIAGVGIDALGIERNQPNHPSHTILLGNRIVILEGLRLKHIKEGKYLLAAFPLKLNDSEAAPVRAVLIETNEAE